MRKLRDYYFLGIAILCVGCIGLLGPKVVRVSDLIPRQQVAQDLRLVFPVVMDRFMDQRSSRNFLGQYDTFGSGGTVTITSDRDISEVFETIVTKSLARKGVRSGSSIFILKGAILRANVGAAPFSKNLNAELLLELSLVNSNAGSLLWQKTYQGVAVGVDPQATLALAFQDLAVSLDRDDSILGLRQTFFASGGKLPELVDKPFKLTGIVAPEPVSDVDQIEKKRAPRRHQDFALVIGITKYQNVPEAAFGKRDAATMKHYLETLGVPDENILFLTGMRATKTGVAKYLEEWLPRNVSKDSRVYFYYSGHGAPDPTSSTAYLLPWDGDPSFLSTTAYPLPRLYEKLHALKAKEVIVMLDSCFSGAGGRSVIAKGTRPLVMTVNTGIPTGKKISVLTASTAKEISGSLDDQGHGMFTYYLLKGIKGEADINKDGSVSLVELHAYVQKSVQRAARRQNRDQTPQLFSSRPDLTIY